MMINVTKTTKWPGHYDKISELECMVTLLKYVKKVWYL
jgi:hypothetical protein